MPISGLSRKRYKVATKVKRWRMRRIRDHTQKLTRLTKTVAVHIRSYVAMMINMVKTFAFIEVKMLSTNLWKRCLKRSNTAKSVIKKHFNKPLVMTEVDEQHFKTMDGCHICGEKDTDKDVHIRDHCHITGKFRAQLTKSVTQN